MDSGMQPPAGEAEILKLFNQFLQANGKQFDINQLNIELKISQKMPGMTTDCDTKGKPQVVEPLNTLPAESTPVPLNPALTHTTQDIQPPADKMSVSTPAIDQLKTLTSDQGFSMSEALSPIPLQRADTLENDKAMSQHRDNRPQEVLSCNRGRSSKEGSQAERLSEGADGAARMTTFRTVIRTSIHPHPADPDSNRSVNSDNTQPELMDAARKDNLLSLKMEELYLKELNSIVRESEIHFQGSSTSRSYIGTLPQKKAKIRRTKTIGKSSSTKNLKEYVKSREMGDLIENGMANPVLIINVLGEHVSLRKRLSNSGLLLPKLKSAAPIMNHATYKDKNSPADNEDDTLRKHFGEVSVLNEEDPSAIESSPHKSDEIDVFKTPEDSGELNYKLSTKKTDTPMKMYPKEDEIIDDEQDYKKKTKISYMMQQSNEDDGCDLLGLLETTHPNGGLFSKYKSTDQRSDNKSDRFDDKKISSEGGFTQGAPSESTGARTHEGTNTKETMLAELIEDLKKRAIFDTEALKKLDMIKDEACEAVQKAKNYERQLKHVENFTNSYSQKSMSKCDMNNTTAFKSMMNMLEELYETEDVLNTTKVYHNFKESNLHFCLMFASPLVIFTEVLGNLKLQTIPWEIDYSEDLSRIKKTLKSVGCDIKFLSTKASTSTFVDVMKKNPMILHFCGHGIDNTRGARAARSVEENIDNYYLLFEDHLGRGELITCDLLTSMISSAYFGKNSLEFVFVASCHSEVTAQVFLNSGASHVLCVAKDEKISDDICNSFAEIYYQAFFCENLTFCEAFESAKSKIAARKFFNGEEKKFKMLLNSQYCGQGTHRCTRFISKPSPESKFIDFTPVPMFSLPKFTHECFLGRNKEIYEIIDLMHHNRFVMIKGMIGIGKSCIQKEIANKIMDRGMFQHGIYYIDLKNDVSLERMHSVFMSDPVMNKLVRRKSGNNDFDLQSAAKEIAGVLAEYKILLIFDNVDSLYVRATSQLKLFFESLINQTTGVKILISQFSKVDNIQGSFSEKVYEVGPLSDHDSAQLLLKRATRRVNEVEILHLFNEHPQTSQTLDRKPQLENHNLIKLFNGMPQIILMAASILHERSLSDLYTLLTSNTSQYQLRPLISEAGNHHLIENSVALALDIVEQIGEKDNLNLVTYFPAGVLYKDLSLLWEEDYAVHLNRLLGYSILYRNTLVEEVNYYTVNGFLMEHFVSNFKPAEVGEHLETLMDVFCNKLRTYFLQIGILSQKKNTALFNFEESNIRCFYHRLKEYYKSMGWDSVEGLSKIAGANSNRKMKLVRLAQNMVEKGTAIKTTTKGSASYYPVGSELKKSLNTRQQTGIPVSKQGLIRNIYDDMIMEEMVEEDDKMLEEAYTSSKKKKKEKETQAKSKKRLEAPVINVKPTQPATTQISKLEGKKAAPSTHQTNKLSKPSSLSMPMNDSPDIRTNNMETKPAEKQQYSGLFSKALVPKPSVTKIDKNASSSVKISPSDQAAVKKPLAAKTSTSYAAKSGAVERKAVQPMKEATTVNRRKNIVISKEKEKPIFEKFGKIVDIAESSEDGPPRKSISSEELFEDLECRVPLSPFANKEIMPIMEFADESMRLESEADIKECQISDSLNNKNEYKELANFDEEVSGELFDPIEKERHKPSPSSPSRVPVISENVASAVLAPIHETQSFSSEEGDSGGDIPRSDSDFRASFKSNQLSQMNSSNIPQHQAQTNSYQLQYSSTSSSYHMPVPISSSNYQMPVPLAGTYDFYSNFNQSDQAKTARKSSFSQMSQNTDVQNESPRQQGLGQNNTMNHMSYMAGSVALSNSSLTHSRNESYVQPELAKKNSKNRRASNVTSSVVSRDSSTKPPTRMSSSSVRAKHSGSILGRERLPSSGNLNSAPANVVSVTTYEEFSSRCKGECSIFAVLYCSILLLNRRDKEASKEISYQFNLGMLNDDLYLVGQMAKLKAVILIFEKKLEQALKFLNLYKDISRIYNDDIGQATSLFGIGYCRFIQGDLIKAKIGFTESSKRYGCLKHVFGEYYSIRNLYKILIKEKKEKEAKEYQERMRNINSAKNIKSCINGIDYKKGTFIMRTRGELLSILIEMASWSDYKEAKDREKFRVKMILKQAAELSEEYCK